MSTAFDIFRRVKEKKLVCFLGEINNEMHNYFFEKYQFEKYAQYFIDSNNSLWGKMININGTQLPVFSPKKFSDNADSNTILLILSSDIESNTEIIAQLNSMRKLDKVECYIGFFSFEQKYRSLPGLLPKNFKMNKEPVIPKLIHYFWFGDKPLPQKHKEFIDNWKKVCPDYEIIKWNERNYDINKHPYLIETALMKRWDKFTDYARLDIIYNYGGIYFDTDVEIIKPIDELLYNNAFIGFKFENLGLFGYLENSPEYKINSGSGFGAVKNCALIKEMMRVYDNVKFITQSGGYDMKFNTYYETEFMKNRGLINDGRFQVIENMAIYPPDFFDPKPSFINSKRGLIYATENTFSVHHYDTTLSDNQALPNAFANLYEAAIQNKDTVTHFPKEMNKVSIVVPCYNKEQYLSAMLESVYNQIWNNMEIIIVNDGSNDGTDQIIANWQPLLEDRGYCVIVKKQKNSGVASAIKAGLELTTGDYICIPDADDELCPEYISAMAEVLDKNTEDDFVACGFYYGNNTENHKSREIKPAVLEDVFSYEDRVEKLLMHKFEFAVWIYLFRREILEQIGIPKNMATEPAVSQEPQIVVPLFFSNARGSLLNRSLYIYNQYANNLNHSLNNDPVNNILKNYYALIEKTIETLPTNELIKKKLKVISIVSVILRSYKSISNDEKSKFERLFIEMLSSVFPISFKNIDAVVEKTGFPLLLQALREKISGMRKVYPCFRGKVYAYGSLGKFAKQLLPIMKNTPLWPDVFWDKAAHKNSVIFDGTRVTVSFLENLVPGDIIMCFPRSLKIKAEAERIAKEIGAVVYTYDEIETLIINFYYKDICSEYY
jgi:glycosyltransferase involved in cell wall biosynthesis